VIHSPINQNQSVNCLNDDMHCNEDTATDEHNVTQNKHQKNKTKTKKLTKENKKHEKGVPQQLKISDLNLTTKTKQNKNRIYL
jgi:hypothetical protein